MKSVPVGEIGISGAWPSAPGGGRLYVPPASSYRDRVRTAQIEDVLARAPGAAVGFLLLIFLLVAEFWLSPARDLLLRWLALAACIGAVPLFAARPGAPRVWTPRTARRAGVAAAVCALAAGLTIGAIPLLVLGVADGEQSLCLLAGVGIALSGAWLCGPIAIVGILYLAPIAGGAAAAFALRGRADAIVVPILLAAAITLANALRRRERAWKVACANRLRVIEQAEMMDALLLDEDADAQGWIWETDAAGRIRNVDPALVASTGLSLEAVEGALMKTILAARASGAPVSEGARAVRRALADRKPFRATLVEIATPHGAAWWRLSGKPLRDDSGAFAGFRGVGTDITAARDTEARIAYLADYDSLTGLANRVQFQAHAARECEAAARDGHWRALLYLDLDGFKSVNDSLGHAAGDLVLKEVARRLAAVAPKEALVARLGGDEFALWYQAKTPSRAEALAQSLTEAIGAPFEIEGQHATIGASIGIAYTPKHALTPDALLGKADLALYRAKADGRGVVRTFLESDEWAVIEKRKLDSDLKLAVACGEFELHYQPLVDLARGEVTAFEALIRWQSPTRGAVPPSEFIPAAEASGLIATIGRWVLTRACHDAAGWPGEIRVAVNVSPKQFADPDFLRSVAVALKASGLPAARLEIEVTEGVFLDNSAAALAHLTALRERGIRVALDDFGTGYSSLSYLTNFPVDKIKIDRSFVRNLERFQDQAIVDAILSLARRLSIKVTAEGVETAEQALALKVRRCDDIQGFLLSRPRANEAVPEMLAQAPAALRAALPAGSDSPLALAVAKRRPTASGPSDAASQPRSLVV